MLLYVHNCISIPNEYETLLVDHMPFNYWFVVVLIKTGSSVSILKFYCVDSNCLRDAAICEELLTNVILDDDLLRPIS